jgi:hypothetical protein
MKRRQIAMLALASSAAAVLHAPSAAAPPSLPDQRLSMDITKRNRLVEQLFAQPEPLLLPIETFFDGNDDLGSIGCNLPEHPGIATFRQTFARIAGRPDVEAIYARISEVDPGDDCWPFADTVFVVGAIPADELASELKALEPDEVISAEDAVVLAVLAQGHSSPVLLAWWD